MSDKKTNYLDLTKDFFSFLWENFENLIRRSLMPSSFLFLLLYIVDTNVNSSLYADVFKKILEKQPDILIYLIIFSILLSTSYIMKILVQVIFDNFIKSNYDCKFPIGKKSTDSCCYEKLRKKTITKLNEVNPQLKELLVEIDKNNNDYLLYLIIGSIYKIKTNNYTDSAKEAGVIALSTILASLYYSYLKIDALSILTVISVSIISILAWISGYYYIKSRYKARAYRIYINLLNDTDEKRANSKDKNS